jgi:hypothetical protein
VKLEPDKVKINRIATATRVDQAFLTGESKTSRLMWRLRRQFLRYYFVRPPIWQVLLRSAFGGERMMPSFVSIGAVRSGTTVLADYIMQHPCVVLPMAKEIGFRRLPKFKYIAAQFPTVAEGKAVEKKYGMAVTGFANPIVPAIAFPYFAAPFNPDVQTIVMLRDPVTRTFAHWRYDQVFYNRMKGDRLFSAIPDFDELVDIEMRLIEGGGATAGFSLSGLGAGHLQHSIYAPFLREFFRVFPRENALVLSAEHFWADTERTIARIYDHIGLPPYEPEPVAVKNAGPRAKLAPETEQKLRRFFAPHNEALFELIGERFDWAGPE